MLNRLTGQYLEAGYDVTAALLEVGASDATTLAAVVRVLTLVVRYESECRAYGVEWPARVREASEAVQALAREAEVEEVSRVTRGALALAEVRRLRDVVEPDVWASYADERAEDAAWEDADSRRQAHEYAASRGVR